jgi:hypothetical protein
MYGAIDGVVFVAITARQFFFLLLLQVLQWLCVIFVSISISVLCSVNIRKYNQLQNKVQSVLLFHIFNLRYSIAYSISLLRAAPFRHCEEAQADEAIHRN